MNKSTKTFSVVYCENNKEDRSYGEKIFKEIQADYPGSLSYTLFDFLELEKQISLTTFSCDLLILDYRDEKDERITDLKHAYDTAGMRILKQNNARTNDTIPTVIFSAYIEKDVGARKLQEMLDKGFSFSVITKSELGIEGFEDLKNFVLTRMVENEFIPFNFKIELETYALKKAFDIIGKANLHQIISKILLAGVKPSLPKISAVIGGLSGAVIVELLQEKTDVGFVRVLIKLANGRKHVADLEALKKEFIAATKYYCQFPRILVNMIDYHWLETADKTIGGFVMAKVEDNKTLLDLLRSVHEESKIHVVLHRLFLGDNSLAKHYDTRRDIKSSHDWKFIFDGFGDKLLRAQNSFIELSALIPERNKTESIFNQVVSLINNMQWTISLDEGHVWHTTNLTLCHGDLHAKNILVQGNIDMAPVLIDTGSLGPAHWTTDLTRLIVYLFSRGIDAGTAYYYDTHEIGIIAGIAKNIIQGEKIQLELLNWDDKRKQNNMGIISALNWLVDNRRNIYPSFYCEYEFNLGLMKWFLREFYRQQTPPNRRVIALLAACDCFEEAQKSVTAMVGK